MAAQLASDIAVYFALYELVAKYIEKTTTWKPVLRKYCFHAWTFSSSEGPSSARICNPKRSTLFTSALRLSFRCVCRETTITFVDILSHENNLEGVGLRLFQFLYEQLRSC